MPFRFRPTFPVLLLLAAIPYACFLWVPFHLDDRAHIVESRGLESIPAAWAEVTKAYFVRAVTGLTFAVERQLWGERDATLYRVANLLLHVANGWLLYGLFRRLAAGARLADGGDEEGFAGIATLLFLLHPLQTGSVTYISGRHGLLSAFFVLAALSAFLDLREGKGGSFRFAAAASLAFGCKEDAIALPVLMGLLSIGARYQGGAVRIPWKAWGWTAGVILLFLAARFGWAWRAPEAAEGKGWVVTEAERMYDRMTYFRTQCAVIPGEYLAKWVLPADLSIDIDPEPRWRWDGGSVSGAALLAAAGAASLAGLLRGRVWGILGLWVLAALAPSSSFQPLEELAAERRTYLATAGLAGLSGLALASAARLPGARGSICVLLVLGASGALSFLRNADYRRIDTLWRGAVLEAPRKGRPYLAMGTAYGEKSPGRASRFYRSALRAQPEDGRPAWMLGLMARARGDLAGAEAWFGRAIATKPNHLPFVLAWADSALARGDWAAAEERLASAAAIDPTDIGIRERLAFVRARAGEEIADLRARAQASPQDREAAMTLATRLRQAGEFDEAIALFERLAGEGTGDVSAWNGLADALFARAARGPAGGGRDDLERALAAIGRSIALAPDDPFLHAFRGQVLARDGRQEEAAGAYRRAVELKGDTPGWWTMLGRALSEAGRPGEAVAAWARALALDPGDLEARAGVERGGSPAPRGAGR